MAISEAKVRPIRRIVTGHDREDRSIVVSDGPSPHVMNLPGVPNFGVTDLWRTHESPAHSDGPIDNCTAPITLAPPKSGTVFRIVEFPPDREYIATWKRDQAFAGLGESGAEALAADTGRHEMMHRTNSVDYAFVLSGEIWAVLDADEVLMKAGDVLIQRATNHAWSNRSDQPCLVGFVLIDALPHGERVSK
jgi:hypothetical protein